MKSAMQFVTGCEQFRDRTLIYCLLMVLFLPTPGFCLGKDHILILHSYNKGLTWTDSEDAGIESVLRTRSLKIDVHTEYMDTKLAADKEHNQRFFLLLKHKYAAVAIRVVLCSDDDAYNFALKNHETLFPEAAIVFCGVNYFKKPADARLGDVVTGIVETFDIPTTIRTALRLHPHAAKVIVINDRTPTGLANRKLLDELIPEFEKRVSFVFFDDLTMAELLDKVRAASPNDVILLLTFNRDRTGKVFTYDDSIALIAQEATAPIYGVWDFYLGKGIVGGMLTSGTDQGRSAAEIALRILDGEKVRDIPVIRESPNNYKFDYPQMTRFGITSADLPPGSIVLNKPVSFYESHKWLVRGGIGGFAGLTLIIILLLGYITERKRAEDALQKLNDELEKRVAERTEELEENRAELEKQNTELQRTYHVLEVETTALHQAMSDLREKERMVIQQSRLAAMGEMLGNIAHQWRQPFNIMGLMIQDLGLSYESGEFSKELLDTNIRKVMEILLHLSQTIDDFSNFTTPDKEKSPFRVNQVVVKTISLVEESLKNKSITIDVSTSDDPLINGYPHEYAQVLLNILINARDAFSEPAMDNERITVRSWKENGRSVVTITDNAGGIKTDILGKIFEPYFTTKDLGKGTGVGLFMSKTIIEKNMGGRLSVRNTDDGVELRIEV